MFFTTKRLNETIRILALLQNHRHPGTLAHKIELFKSRGHLVNYEEECFQDASWITMYNGFNIIPRKHDPRADAIDTELLRNHLLQMKSSVENAALGAISHDAFIQRHCAAEGQTDKN